jgi:hypothetical protein
MPRQRNKIRSDNVRDEIIKLLRRNTSVSKAEINAQMHPVAQRLGLEFRDRAVSECLTALKREGFATNATWGVWQITGKGSK